MTQEEARQLMRALFDALGRVTRDIRAYREGRGMKKGREVEAIADDYYRWKQIGMDACLIYSRPAMRLKMVALMKTLDSLLEGR